jgi:hypothetical protein
LGAAAASLTADGWTVAHAHRLMHDEMTVGMRDFLSRYTHAELATLAKILRGLLVRRHSG